MALLNIIQNACDRLSIVRPTQVISSTDQQVRKLLGLAQQEGKELARAYFWQVLTKEHTFTSIAAETQTAGLPADFSRIINRTFYNRTQNRRLEGPMSQPEWQSYKASISTVLFDAFRVRGSSLLIAPTPTAGDTYAYEYLTKYWVAEDGSTTPTKDAWDADTNVGILDEELMTLGVIWRFKKASGLDYAEEFRTYQLQLDQAKTMDGGGFRDVNLAGPSLWRGPIPPRFPDGNWNLS